MKSDVLYASSLFIAAHVLFLVLAAATYSDGYISEAIQTLIISILFLLYAILINLYYLVHKS